MKLYAAFSDIQVIGRLFYTFRSGLGPTWTLASRMMLEEELGTMGPDGLIQFDPDQWYPLPGHLRALDRIQRDLGEVALRQMGSTVPRLARRLELRATDIRSALEQVDLAFHANHARAGQVMYSDQTGVMLEGIGHYRVLAGASGTQVRVECTDPYPCVFDQALLLTFVQQLNPAATLVHLEPESCRARGSAGCTYGLSWP